MNVLDNKFDENKISISKYSDIIYNIKYQNKGFLIKPGIAFSNSSCFLKNMYKVRININMLNKDHQTFKYLIDRIYDGISLCIEKDDTIDVDIIIRPTIKSNILSNTQILHLIINKNTELVEYVTDKILDKELLVNKRFTIYPIINPPNIKVSNKMFVNFSLKKAFIRFDGNITKNNDVDVTKQELYNAFSKVTNTCLENNL
jgi:hypothetical protein